MVFTALILRSKFHFFFLLFSVTSNPATFLWLFQANTWISIEICRGLFTFYVQWVEVRGDCSLCWYWWNYWPSLFKLSLFCWYWWNYWPSRLNFLCFVDIGGIIDHHCLSCLLFCWQWWNYWPSLFKLSFVLLILVELLTITV